MAKKKKTKSTPVKLYEPYWWKDKVQMFRCLTCQFSLANEDQMKLHVLQHVPDSEQDNVLDQLVKEDYARDTSDQEYTS